MTRVLAEAGKNLKNVVAGKTNKIIRYFGYGANASADMMKALIGRKPTGYVAWLEGYELWIQSWQEVPANARKILKNCWNPDFMTYCVSPKQGKKAKGRVWFLTRDERRQVSKWEFWYQSVKVRVRMKDGRLTGAETEIVKRQPSNKIELDGERYKLFLNNKKKMLKIAKMRRSQAKLKMCSGK